MDDILLHRSEDPLQHIVEMHAYIRSYTAGLMHITFPGGVVPFAAGGDIRQIHVVDLVFRTVGHFLFQRTDLVVQTELQNGICLMACLPLLLYEVVDIVRVEHQRFLADDVTTDTQAVTNESIMGVVRRTDRQPLQGVVRTHLFGTETIKLLILREEGTIRKGTVRHGDRI